MKNEIYKMRMIKFANHLKNIEKNGEEELIIEHFYRDNKRKQFSCEVSVNLDYLRELKIVFPDLWVDSNPYSEHFGPVYIHQTKLGIICGLGKFFNVGCKTIRHFFDISGKQNISRWHGVRLYYNSKGKDFARNIFEYLDIEGK